MPGHGGKRAGAGSKPKTEKYKTPINRAEKRIADRLPELVDRLFDLAGGVRVMDPDGEVYTEAPCYKALEYLVNRVMGRPTERHEQEHTGALTIRVEYADASPDDHPDPAPAPSVAAEDPA